MSYHEDIIAKVADRSLVVGVVGLGYVGLPLALAFSKKYRTIGFDTSRRKVAMLRSGESYIDDVASVDLTRFEPTSDEGTLSRCDVVIICVPTPLHEDKRPDLGAVKAASLTVGRNLKRGALAVLESTTYPGTTETVMVPLIEEASGLRALDDFGAAYSPERIDPGNRAWRVENTPKVVGALTPEWADAAAAVYGSVIERIVRVSDCGTAEMVKIFENIFRNVNIALANEMALICEHMGIDAWEVIEAAGTKPYGFMAFQPGPGVGGHCIPLDPYYLAYRARQFNYMPRFIETAGELNDYMPVHVVNLARKALGVQRSSLHGRRIAVLGLSYKPDVSDTRESPAIKVIEELVDSGAEVRVHDPLAGELATARGGFRSEPDLRGLLEWCDLAVLHTPHKALLDELAGVDISSVPIVDARNALGKRDGVTSLGRG